MSDSWHNGIAEAVERMREHLGDPAPIKFDTRDRAALNYILNTLEERAELARNVFLKMRGYVRQAEDSSSWWGGGDKEDAEEEMNELAVRLGVTPAAPHAK